MTLADCAYPKTEESFLFLWCLCVYARSAVSAKAQATSATAVSNCLEYLTALPLIHEVYPAALKKFQHSSGLKRSQISPIALMR